MQTLCDCDEGLQLFSQLFSLIETHKGDEEMQENIMWLVNAMVEQTETQGVISMCAKNNVIQIIADQISADRQETVRVILITYHDHLDTIANNAHTYFPLKGTRASKPIQGEQHLQQVASDHKLKELRKEP